MRATLLYFLTLAIFSFADTHGSLTRRHRSKRQSTGTFSAIIAFGGSYSDNGHARASQYASSLTGSPYAGGRKTNGSVSVEYIASTLSAQLRNYAYNGAQIDNSLVSADVPSVVDQVGTFINDVNSGVFASGPGRTLIHFYAGVESLVSIWQTCVNAGNTAAAKSAAATKVTQHVNALLARVALIRGNTPNCGTDYVFMTLPPLEVVLQVALSANWDSAKLNTMMTLEMQFNSALVAGAASLSRSFSKVTVVQYRDFWYDAQYHPGAYGLTQGGTACYSGSGAACSAPNSYLYFDRLNPSTAVHRLLADRTLTALGLPTTTAPPPLTTSLSSAQASSTSSIRYSSRSSVQTTSPTPSASATPTPATPITGYFSGANSYYLHTIRDTDRRAILDAMAGAGMRVVRIFINEVPANQKGSDNPYVPDLEQNTVGVYQDQVLLLVDQLMVDCKARGLRLIIAVHDRYSLGYWATDAYAIKYGIVPPGTSGSPQTYAADPFYTSQLAMNDFDNRIRYIMSHRNALLGNLKWSELDSVIYAIEAENEPQGHLASANSNWACGRSAVMRSTLPAGSIMHVSSGGGVDRPSSLNSWAVDCAAMSIVSVHTYDLADLQNNIASAKSFITSKGKIPLVGEYGAVGSSKATQIGNAKNVVRNQGVPQMVWQVVKPGNPNDYEIAPYDVTWQALVS